MYFDGKKNVKRAKYSKVSIKRLVLLNDLSGFFQKVSIKRSGPSQKKIDRTV